MRALCVGVLASEGDVARLRTRLWVGEHGCARMGERVSARVLASMRIGTERGRVSACARAPLCEDVHVCFCASARPCERLCAIKWI